MYSITTRLSKLNADVRRNNEQLTVVLLRVRSGHRRSEMHKRLAARTLTAGRDQT